jgi:hypothetical protein
VLIDLVKHLVNLDLAMWLTPAIWQVDVGQHVLVAFVPVQPPEQLVA